MSYEPRYGIKVQATKRGINQVTSKLSPQVLLRHARESLQDCLDELHQLVVRKVPDATGETAGNIFTRIDGESLADLEGIVASPDAWFPVLEFGRRAGSRMPPQLPIEEWMDIRGIDRSASYVIRRAIARNGTRAMHIMHDALDEGKEKFATIWFKRFLADWGRGDGGWDS